MSTKTIDGSALAPGSSPHGVVIKGNQAIFTSMPTNNMNAQATFLFVGLEPPNGPGTVSIRWDDLQEPGYDSQIDFYNYRTGQFEIVVQGVTEGALPSFGNYISQNGELQAMVSLNLANGTLDSITVNYE